MTNQEKRDKVIKGLECCARDYGQCGNCPYDVFGAGRKGCGWELYKDALALLKAQEPRVMTWHDVIGAVLECKPVYIEVKDSEDKERGDDRWAMLTQYKDSMANGMILAMSSYVISEVLFADLYNKSWRCWTSRPDQETREAVKWE